MGIGQTISKRRKELGMTQQNLADQLFVTVQAISKWETGVGNPDINFIPEIARCLHMSINELFDQPSNNLEIKIIDEVDNSRNRTNEIILLLSGLFLMIGFAFCGFKYQDDLIHLYRTNWYVYGLFLGVGLLVLGVGIVTTYLSKQNTSAKRRLYYLSTFPLFGMISLYFYFIQRYNDFSYPFPLLGLSEKWDQVFSLAFYIILSSTPLLFAYNNRLNKKIILPVLMINIIVISRFIMLEVLSTIFITVAIVIILFWSLVMIRNIIKKIGIHAYEKNYLLLPIDVALLLVFVVMIANNYNSLMLNLYMDQIKIMQGVVLFSLASPSMIISYVVLAYFEVSSQFYYRIMKKEYDINKFTYLPPRISKYRTIIYFSILVLLSVFSLLQNEYIFKFTFLVKWITILTGLAFIFYDAVQKPIINKARG